MITEIDASLLEKIADLTGKPVGAFNIRKDSGCEARQSTEHIAIDPQPEGKSGIIIRIKDGTKGEQCHIPVIISKSGVTEMVYNDFYVGENCDVDIVAGCGIHNSGCNESRHDGVHTFYVSKNSHVRYVEKHYGEGDGEGSRVMNPTTIVYLDEGASIQMETVQIRGIDSTVRKTKIVCGKGAEAVITVLRPCAVRLDHHGQGHDRIHPRHHREFDRRAAHPRGCHRQDRRRPALKAPDPWSHRGGGRRHDSQGLPRLKNLIGTDEKARRPRSGIALFLLLCWFNR